MSHYFSHGDTAPHSTRLGIRGFRRSLSALLATMLSLLLPLSTTFMAWKGLCLLTNSGIPIVCVVSESMAPAFHRGDVLVLWNRTASIRAGDIPVVWFDGNPLPMVHRVVQVFTEESASSQQPSAG
jgi:signal peptidase I